MDLVSFVPGVGATAVFTPGVNTPNVNGATHTGVTDGTGPSTAANNMAEIYNRLLLQVASIIVKSGLSVDDTNWAQAGVAVKKIADDSVTTASSNYLTPGAASAIYETIVHASSTYATSATVNSLITLSDANVFIGSTGPGVTTGVALPAGGTWKGIWVSTAASSTSEFVAAGGSVIGTGFGSMHLFAVRVA